MNKHNLFFVLGGEDNEMAEIKEVLSEAGILWYQPQIAWGKICVDVNSLPRAAKDKHLVFVEAQPRISDDTYTLIDHHNERFVEEASLLQVLRLLELTPTFRQKLIASIDANFLFKTIEDWPEHKEEILEIWESGYRKGFSRHKDYIFFKNRCQKLYEGAKGRRAGEDEIVVVFQAPSSMTMIAAMANLDNLPCILINGSEHSDLSKPCFYHGDIKVVNELANLNFDRKYRGKYYLGGRCIPKIFIAAVKEAYRAIA